MLAEKEKEQRSQPPSKTSFYTTSFPQLSRLLRSMDTSSHSHPLSITTKQHTHKSTFYQEKKAKTSIRITTSHHFQSPQSIYFFPQKMYRKKKNWTATAMQDQGMEAINRTDTEKEYQRAQWKETEKPTEGGAK
ncbi:hypothetical protein Vi05172_g8197 [Venturia inaequalis]|nr:hypothetical protein Vi05172_g8197 [Venturia inaequalis]